MIWKVSARKASLLFTVASVCVALVSIQLGRRMNYLEHLPLFNALAVTMLGLVGVGFLVALVSLIKARGRNVSLWWVAVLAIVVLGSYLLDE